MTMDTLGKNLFSLLDPLVRNDVELNFPFFANTYPLAFHYAKALKNGPKIRDNIRRVTWGRYANLIERTGGSRKRVRLIFETEEGVKALKGKLRKEYEFRKTFFTNYRPSHVFVRGGYHLSVSYEAHKKEHGSDGPPLLSAELLADLTKGYERFEMYSDTPSQAEFIGSKLSNDMLDGRKIAYVHNTFAPLTDAPERDVPVFPIFFYGAPTTSALLNQSMEFLPIRLDFRKEQLADFFKTYLYVLIPASINMNQSGIDALVQALNNYHSRLFRDAVDKPHLFHELSYHYNRIAQLTTPHVIFKDGAEYAKCIRDHHFEND